MSKPCRGVGSGGSWGFGDGSISSEDVVSCLDLP